MPQTMSHPMAQVAPHLGGVPQAKWDAAKGDTTKLPSIHSAQWAPDPDVTIATATEALTLAAMTVMPKR